MNPYESLLIYGAVSLVIAVSYYEIRRMIVKHNRDKQYNSALRNAKNGKLKD